MAGLLARDGWDVQLWEKEPHLGGGCRTFFHCGHPYMNGPRLFYGYSAKIFDYLNAIVPIKRFPFELRTLAHEPNDADRRFWSYPPHSDDLAHYPRAATIAAELAACDNSKEPADFDEYYLQKIGPTLYEMFTEKYSKRMWMVDSNKVFDIFRWSAKDRPIETGTREAYKNSFIGYPVPHDGYNSYFDHMTQGVDVRLSKEWKLGDATESDIVISTIPIDEFRGYEFGELPYAGRDFFKLMLPCAQVFPGDVRFCHYAGENDTWTRATEFKKLTYHESDSTLLILERPSKNGKLYPYQTKANVATVKKYIEALPTNTHSIGRLGRYLYSTIENTISQAFACAQQITGKPNELADQFFVIGDKSLLPSDRKVKAL